MTRRWKAAISVAIALFAGAHAVVLCTGQQHWPIAANSGMWATRMGPTFECMVTYAVPADPAKADFPLSRKSVVSSLWLAFAFQKLLHYPARSAGYERAVAGCPPGSAESRDRCASQRLIGEVLSYLSDGYARKAKAAPPGEPFPPLSAMDLYEVRYLQLPTGEYRVVDRDRRARWQLAPGGEAPR